MANTIVYTGSIRSVNNLSCLVNTAAVLKRRGNRKIKILIWGDGDELEALKEYANRESLNNIIFKGKAEKSLIPAILVRSNCTVLHNSSTSLNKYGQSQNKLFEYLAAGKPVIMTYSVGYSVCREKRCGIELEEQTPDAIADAFEYVSELTEQEYQKYCENAVAAVKEFDYAKLTQKILNCILSNN